MNVSNILILMCLHHGIELNSNCPVHSICEIIFFSELAPLTRSYVEFIVHSFTTKLEKRHEFLREKISNVTECEALKPRQSSDSYPARLSSACLEPIPRYLQNRQEGKRGGGLHSSVLRCKCGLTASPALSTSRCVLQHWYVQIRLTVANLCTPLFCFPYVSVCVHARMRVSVCVCVSWPDHFFQMNY